MDLDLSCVTSFLVLLEERHFGRAAQRLHISSSALTKRVQRLERQLGVVLVQRYRAEGVTATEAGRRFAGPARQLIASAHRAHDAARGLPADPRRQVVLGIPAGPRHFLRQLGLGEVVESMRDGFPGVHVVCRQVGFTDLTSSLLDREIDVLWTATAVRHHGVISACTPITTGRVGLLPPHHDYVALAAIDGETFAELPLLYNPFVPPEWMSLFYLGDIRPRREAQLVSVNPHDSASVIRAAATHKVASVTPQLFGALASPHLTEIPLTGVPDLIFHVAQRRQDRRGAVHGLMDLLQHGPPRRITAPSDRPADL